MRKLFNFFAAALVMLAAASCEKNEVLPDSTEGKVVTITARIGTGHTKTSLGDWNESDQKYPVLWNEGDYIGVVNNGRLLAFKLSTGAGSTVGTFTCTSGSAYYDPTKPIQAFYPMPSSVYNNSTKEISYVVPQTQAYALNSFGLDAMPMAAYAANENEGLVFNNLFGAVKLQLTGAAGESLRCVEFVSNKAVSGSSIITINDESSSIILAETPNIEQKKVVLECENPISLSTDAAAPTMVLIAVPGGVEHDFSVYIVTDKGAYYKKVSSAKEIVAGEIKKMGVLNLSGSEFDGKRMSYVENGVYLGEGIAQPEGSENQFVWAPVNCGYTNDNKYGLLYKFGSNSGISYNGTIPTTISNGNSCPVGWRVPTKEELETLSLESNYKSTLNQVDGVSGLYFYLDKSKSVNEKIFLPAAGMLKVEAFNDPIFDYKDASCVYWSSTKKKWNSTSSLSNSV